MFAGSPPGFAGPAFFVDRCALSGTLYRTCRRGSPGSLPPSPDGSGRLAGFARRGCFPCSRSMIARGHTAVASFCPCCLLVFFRGLCLTPCTYLVAVALPAHPRLGLRVGGFAGFACWKPFPGFMNVVRPRVSVCGCCCRLCWLFCPRALFGLNSCLLPWRPDSRPPSPSGAPSVVRRFASVGVLALLSVDRPRGSVWSLPVLASWLSRLTLAFA